MAVYTAKQLETDLKLRLKVNSTNRDALLLLWMNDIVERIWKEHDWSFYIETETVDTVNPASAGTVSITKDSTAVVGTGTAFASNQVGAFITFGTSRPSYTILSVTDATNLVLDHAFQDTTDASSTYEIQQARIAVPADYGHTIAISIRDRWIFPPSNFTPIDWLHLSTGDFYTGDPRRYVVFHYKKNLFIHFWPIPQQAFPAKLLYVRRPTLVTTVSADSLDIPTDHQFNEMVRHGIIEKYAEYEKDAQQWNIARASYNKYLELAKADDRKDQEMPQKEKLGSGRKNYTYAVPQSDWFD